MANDTTVIIRARDETAAAFRSAISGMGQVEKSLGGLNSAFSQLPLLGTALAGAFGAVSFSAVISDSIHFSAALDDMAAKTGASVENLSALASVAKIGGHDLGMVEGTLVKLAKALSGTGEEGEKATRALKAIGLSQNDLRGLDTAEAMHRVSQALSGYADGAGKTALAIDLLGKAGADALPFMQDLAEQGKLVAEVTAEQAAQAERLEKSYAALKKSAADVGKSIAMSILPALSEWSVETAETAKRTGGLIESMRLFGTVNPYLQATTEKISELNAEAERLRSSPIFFGSIEGRHKEIKDVNKQIEVLKALQQQKALANASALGDISDARDLRLKHPQPSLNYTTKPAKSKKDKALKQSGPVGGLDDADSIMAVLKANEEIEKARQSSAAAMAALSAQFGEQNRAAAEALLIMPEAERRLAEQVKAVGDAAQKTRDEMTRAYAAGNLPLDEFMAKLIELRGVEESQVGAVRALAMEQDKLNASWEVGAQKALTAYLETARNTAKQFEDAFTTSFALIEDGLTRFITTGKGDMRQFATAIIQQFARIAVAKTVSGFAGMMFGGNGNFQPGQGYMGGGGFAWNAKGGVYNSPSLSAYSGQVHSTPQAFTFAKGAGIFGEAGPEAIMPLSRDSQGRLGVKAEGGTRGGDVNITMHIDATGGKTQGDAGAAGDLGRKLEGAVRGVLMAEMRPGGLLAA